MQVRHWIVIGIFMGALASPARPQQFFAPPTPPVPPAQASRTDRDYQEGTAALDARQYSQAIAAFERVVAAKGSQADGAIYWIAYARNKQGRRGDALVTLAELRRTYPSSRWLSDARALDVEIRQASGQTIAPASTSDEETKLMVLNSLIGSNPERIVPVLEKLLNSQNSTRVKEKALFVLAQSNSPSARNLLVQIAKGGSNPELRTKAVEYLGIFGGKQNHQLLADVYKSSNDVEIKKRVLNSFMISGDRDDLLAAAKSESNPELRMEAVRLLGITGGTDELWQLYRTESSTDVKKAILQGLFLSGKPDKLFDLARNEKDPELRRTAIRQLGLMGRDKTGTFLTTLYAQDQDKSVKRAVIDALFIEGNSQAVVSLARKEPDPELKRELVQKLSLMHSKDGDDYLLEMLNK